MRLDKIAVILIVLAIAITASIIYFMYIPIYVYRGLESRGVFEEYTYVVDIANRSVKVPRNLSRVVAIGPGALRLISYLDSIDVVVGVEEIELSGSPVGRDYAMAYYKEFKVLPIIGAGGPRSTPDPEKLRAVKPQLIIMSKLYADLYDPDRLAEEVNASVLVVDYGAAGYLEIESLKKAFRILGKALNREDRAEELCRYIDYIVSDLHNRTYDIAKRPKIYIGAISYKGAQPFTSTQARFAPLILLNTQSIADSISSRAGFITVDFEYLVKEQPDIVFIDENNLNVVLDDFQKDPSKYCVLKAFKDGKVYGVLPFNWYHTNIATALADAYFIGKTIYPDRFIDVDPIAKADEIFQMFVGKRLYSMFIDGGYQGFANLFEMFRCS
jgi:iron complex transport system substrate-binding protein